MGLSYQNLIVWQKAVDFIVAVYEANEAIPEG